MLTDEERKSEVIFNFQKIIIATKTFYFFQLIDPEHRIDPLKHRKAELVFPETTRDFEQLPLEFQGFCSHHLTANNGLLIPSVRNIGILQHKGRFYGFSSREAADSFIKSPDRYMMKLCYLQSSVAPVIYYYLLSCLAIAVDVSKRSPELIQLLDMHVHFASGTPGTRQVNYIWHIDCLIN